MTEEPGVGKAESSLKVQNEKGFEQVDSRELMEGIALNRQSHQIASRIISELNIRETLEELRANDRLNGSRYEVEDFVRNVSTFTPDSTSPSGIRQTTIPVVGVVVRERTGNKLGITGTFFGLVGSPVPLRCKSGEIVNVNVYDRMCFGQELNIARKKGDIGEWARDAREGSMPLSAVSLSNHLGSPADLLHEPMFDSKETTISYLSWQQNEFLGNKASIDAVRAMVKTSVTEKVLPR